MDYQVDHSSFSTDRCYAHIVAVGANNQPWLDQFGFSSSSIDAVPTLRRWKGAKNASIATTDAPSASRATQIVSPVKVKKKVSPSTNDETKVRLVSERLEYIYWNDAAALIDSSQSRTALRGVVDAVEDLVDVGDYLTLDNLLAGVDPKRLRPITNVAFLRSSFQAKDKLSNWKLLYQVVYAHLANSGQDPTRALRGLSASRISNFA
ncbi:hypothetical protein [Pseudomonas mandelii]|uniref:hypothetical protein n=1 Tax=Pseudomonas mandelii TaxID=75612 RepID=UPI00224AD92C|nr:hypothetical protein [Pseudomonas mandelii]MCX2896826.1 hypothetical protein [Pseudomonas mandelii]